MHEQERFANIDAGKFEENDDNDNMDQITLLLKDKSVLPEGYHWEEKGREFSYKGMFYDIVSIEQTKEGWVIKAASDEEQTAKLEAAESIITDSAAVVAASSSPRSDVKS